jgi:Transglycosylase-like domain
MRKHRLYGVSLAMLATAGGALSYPLISAAATNSSGKAQNGHAANNSGDIVALGNNNNNDLYGPSGSKVSPKRHREVVRYLTAVHHQQVADYINAAEVNQYLTTALDQQAWYAALAQQAQQALAAQEAAQAAAQRQAQASSSPSSSSSSSHSSSQSSSSASSSSGSSASGWDQVAICEEGGRNDPTYGYFGITPSSWQAYGGGQYSSTAGGASESEQITIAERISPTPPDQGGCTGGW